MPLHGGAAAWPFLWQALRWSVADAAEVQSVSPRPFPVSPRPNSHLKGLHKRPEQDADSVTLAEELDKSGCPEEPQEAEVDEVVLRKVKVLCPSEINAMRNHSPQKRN